MRPIEEYSDDELLSVIRKAENSYVPGSLHQQASNEWQIRQSQKILEATKSKSRESDSDEIKKGMLELLNDPQYKKRKFSLFKKRFYGLSDDDLRSVLRSLGAMAFFGKENGEQWGLRLRNLAESTTISSAQGNNPHSEYWKYILASAKPHVKAKHVFYLTLASVLLILVFFGYLRFSPEISTPFGKFTPNSDTTMNATSSSVSLPPSDSKKMDISVFELSTKTDYGAPILNIQKKWEGYKGLTATNENAILINSGDAGYGKVWADLESVSQYDGKTGHVTCVFSSEWTQRIELLGEKERNKRLLTFSGTISGDLSQGQLPVLEDCKLQ